MAIGQEISVTLLQMALLFGSVANGGILVEPCMVEKIIGPDSLVNDGFRYKPVRRVITVEVANRLKAMMCEVVNAGTGTKAAIKGVAVAGKTGTAQKIDKATGSYSEKRAWASFIGFLPAENPLLLGAVVIDEPANAEMGGAAAAPVFQKIMSQIISHPQLEYAERILRQPPPPPPDLRKSRGVPDMCGMPFENAVSFLATEQLPFEIIGDKKGKIAFQSPQAGATLEPNKKMTIYTCPSTLADKNSGMVMAPQCVGKDLRDAVNALNLKGLVPYVRGAGTVRGQSPRAGSFVKYAEQCTLSCSFNTVLLSAAQPR
jgi:membrane peptidoglycan carboxypeptidase